MPVTVRLRLLGCASVAALVLSGCGGGDGGGGTQGGEGPGSTGGPSAQAGGGFSVAGKECQGQVGGFVGSLDALRRRLAVGLAYEQYVHEVEGIRSAYRRIPAGRLALECLNEVGAPSERSFNVYIDAANAWGECVGEAGCEAATVEPVLQRRWRVASHLLSQAHRSLRGLGAG